MTRLATRARLLEAVQADQERTEDLAVAMWRAVQSLSVCPKDCLARNRVAMIEAHELLGQMLAETARDAVREPAA
jgi:hypothetical protein